MSVSERDVNVTSAPEVRERDAKMALRSVRRSRVTSCEGFVLDKF